MLKKVQTETILTYLIRVIPPLSIAVVVVGLFSMSILLKRPDLLLRTISSISHHCRAFDHDHWCPKS